MELVFAFVTGIASAAVYSLIQGAYNYFRWIKTKKYFTGEIYGSMSMIFYYFANVLDIEVIRVEFGEEILLSDDDFVEEVKSMPITERQYKHLNRILENTRNRIQILRKEALSVPIFTAADFHAVDEFLADLGHFLTFYSWIEEDEVLDEKTSDHLKENLAKILEKSKTYPFSRNLLDNLSKWYNRRYFFIKNRINHHKKSTSDFDTLPF